MQNFVSNHEDKAWERYKQASPAERELVAETLYKLLQKHALAVTYEITGESRPYLAHRIVTRAFAVMGSFEGRSSFHTWFHRVAINACKMWLRQRDNRREDPEPVNSAPDATEMQIVVQELLAQLPEDEQELLQMKLEGYDEGEIGIKTNLSRGGVSSKWTRLRKKLLGLLEYSNG